MNNTQNASKIIRIDRDGESVFTMTVAKGKDKEEWTYEREEHSDGCVSFSLIGREYVGRAR
jgi:hypothetical protein